MYLTWLPYGPGLAKCLTQCSMVSVQLLGEVAKGFCLILGTVPTSSGQTNWLTQYVVLVLSI